MVGSLGSYIGTRNLELFGYLGYLDFIFLLYPVYRLYRLEKFEDFEIESFLAWLLFLFSLLILQALIFNPPFEGWIGGSIVGFLHPFIGDAGVWLFWLMTLTLSGVILWGESIHWKISDIKEMLKSEDTIEAVMAEKPVRSPKGRSGTKQKEDLPNRDTPEEGPGATAEDGKETEPSVSLSNVEPAEEREPGQEPESGEEGESKGESSKRAEHANIEIVQEIEENRRLLEQIDIGEQEKPKNFKLPKLDFLQKPPRKSREINEVEIDEKISDLLDKLSKFKPDTGAGSRQGCRWNRDSKQGGGDDLSA